MSKSHLENAPLIFSTAKRFMTLNEINNALGGKGPPASVHEWATGKRACLLPSFVVGKLLQTMVEQWKDLPDVQDGFASSKALKPRYADRMNTSTERCSRLLLNHLEKHARSGELVTDRLCTDGVYKKSTVVNALRALNGKSLVRGFGPHKIAIWYISANVTEDELMNATAEGLAHRFNKNQTVISEADLDAMLSRFNIPWEVFNRKAKRLAPYKITTRTDRKGAPHDTLHFGAS